MSQRNGSKSVPSRSGSRKKTAASFIIRDVEEKLNRSGVNALRIDSTNHILYTAGRDSIIRAWDIENADNKDIRHLKSMEHHTDWISDIVLCMDNKNIMSASSDTTLKVWDVSRGTCSSTLRTHKDYVRCLAYAKERELVASGGLDKAIFLWDVKTLTSLTAANNTVTTSTLAGHKESIYSLAMNDEGTVVVSGSTEKMICVWDPRSCERVMNLKGHSDNVRSIVINRDGMLILSGSSDGTVRLWSLGQQRCIETFHVHDEGVWALAVDEEFNTFYSGGRDKRVCVTELTMGGQEGLVLCTEDSPILDLALDCSGKCDSLWVATTSTHINKWPIDPNRANGFHSNEEGSSEEEEKLTVTDIDDPPPFFSKPITTLPGGSSIKEYYILNNRQQVLTRDSRGDVVLWDILHGCMEKNLGKADFEEEAEKRKVKFYIPNWFSVEIKTGMLNIKLEENDCFSAWVVGCNTLLDTASPDIKLNLGALMLKALFEHWPRSTKSSESEKEVGTPSTMDLETVIQLCGGEQLEEDLWGELGRALGLSEEKLHKIGTEEGDNSEKCKQCTLHVWLTESEEVSWEKFAEALDAIKAHDLAKKVREEHCTVEEVNKDDNIDNKINTKFFSVPLHTPVILSEAGDCGTTMTRVLCSDMGGNHESRQLDNYCPIWIVDIVCQQKLPDSLKLNFFLGPYSEAKNDRLSAQDLLIIRKVQEYVYDKLHSSSSKRQHSEEEDRGSDIDILCADQVLDPVLDLRTVKHSIWRSGGDMKLYYRVKKVTDKSHPPSPDKSDPPPKDKEQESEGRQDKELFSTNTTPSYTETENISKE